MKKMKNIVFTALMSLCLFAPKQAKADMFGGDVVVLTQILANAIQQLVQLREILSTGSDTLSLMRDINRGIRDGLTILQMINPRFNPGIYGNLETADRVLGIINDLYGKIPQTTEARLQQAQDQSASESIAMNGPMFRFADQADEESRRIAYLEALLKRAKETGVLPPELAAAVQPPCAQAHAVKKPKRGLTKNIINGDITNDDKDSA